MGGREGQIDFKSFLKGHVAPWKFSKLNFIPYS